MFKREIGQHLLPNTTHHRHHMLTAIVVEKYFLRKDRGYYSSIVETLNYFEIVKNLSIVLYLELMRASSAKCEEQKDMEIRLVDTLLSLLLAFYGSALVLLFIFRGYFCLATKYNESQLVEFFLMSG